MKRIPTRLRTMDRPGARWTLALTLGALALATGILFMSLTGRATLAQDAAGDVACLDTAQSGVARSPTALPYTTLVDLQMREPETLDPHWMYDSVSAAVAMQVYETLVTFRREDSAVLVPQLATQWDVSADKSAFTFTIRSGVRFHAGGTLEAHDVAYSFWRGLLQERTDGATWILFPALFENAWSVEDLPGDDLAKCEALKDAITFDDMGQTVTFHLAQPLGPFPYLLTTFLGAILDQEWMAANGDWAGDCADWRDYHDPAVDASILYDQMNGTGPFRFDHWTPGEIGLVRHDSYWRQEPAWPEGPSGPAALESVLIKTVADAAARRDMLLQGEADLANIAAEDFAGLDPWVWGLYIGYEDRDPTLLSPAGTLLLYRDLPGPSQMPDLLNFNVVTDTTRYIGSGALDGDGIPPDFFSDLHMRKAFNYAMDWTTVISDAYGGEGLRARGPIPAGMLGFTEAQPVYPHSLTLAAAEFQQAWGGQVWTHGFSMTIPYNLGNLGRQRMAEVLAANVEAINSAFHVNVIGMDWADVLPDFQSGRLPAFPGGWISDYHHPHNWVAPFLDGIYADRMRYPQDLRDLFAAKIAECAQLLGSTAAQTCYEEIQRMSYDNAMAMWGYQGVARRYMRTEVRGYYYSPGNLGDPNYYALSKGPPPSTEVVDPAVSNTLVFTDTAGATATLDLPAGAVSETSTIVYTPDTAVAESHPGGLRLGGMAFDLQICQEGECLPAYTFDETVNLTLSYRDEDIAGLIEDQLYLYTWDGTAWADAVADCGWPPTAYGRHPEINELLVPLCHASRFAVVGGTHNIYLPLVRRNSP